ncbi:M56 family metallopeptidase [Butyrivibrio sp. JL13D10]|uniref:M56 family metallopeptidase n=1 Tax=Butyrivibrio sp. JL13D10 TaxID=3236815 RepID=UPI0038B5F986
MGTVFIKIIEMSIAASFLMLAVILIRFPFKKAPKWFMGVLWTIVALRLAIPIQIETKIGLMPDFSGVIENFFNTAGTGSGTSVTTHNFVSYPDAGYVSAMGRSDTGVKNAKVKENLPAEEIITTHTSENRFVGSIQKSTVFRILCAIWILGVIAVIGYAIVSFASIWKKTRASIKLTDNTAGGRVYISDEIETPFILGIIRPSIFLPSGLDDETRRNVLAHEKAHIRRKDHLRKQFGFLLLAIHWFNPLVWISYMLFCKDIELSCDESVISRMSLDEKKSYATSLLLCSTHRKLILAYPLAFGEVGVKTRVKQIFNYKKPSFWLIMMLVVISTMLSACFMTNSASEEKSRAEDIKVEPGTNEAINSEEAENKNTDSNGVITKELNTDENEINQEEISTTEIVKNNNTKQTDFEASPNWQLLNRWNKNFEDRNVQGILADSVGDVQTKLVNEGVLFKDEDGEYFGWSSPWPSAYQIKGQAISCAWFTDEEQTEGEIHYYAMDSEPHLYVWVEKIKLGEDDDGTLKVVGEHLDMYDDIDSFEDFERAYFYNSSDNDAINYSKNGLGEYLNDHAKSDTDGLYGRYFDPVLSARYLLNLSDDESKVVVSRGEDNSEGTVISIKFVKENKFMDILMIKPWGEDGIYVPRMKMPKNNYGVTTYELNDDEAESRVIDSPENDDLDDADGAGNLLYTEDTEAKIGTLPYSDDVEYFEDIHKGANSQSDESGINETGGDEKENKPKVIDLGE